MNRSDKLLKSAWRKSLNKTRRSKSFDGHIVRAHLVTIWLADSLPQIGASKSSTPRRALPYLARVQRLELEDALDAGYGCCALARPESAKRICNSLRALTAPGFAISAWVIMPTHLHLLIRRKVSSLSLHGIVRRIKRATRNLIADHKHPIASAWANGFMAHSLHSRNELTHARCYIKLNPVARGLCARAEDWRFGYPRRTARPDRMRAKNKAQNQLGLSLLSMIFGLALLTPVFAALLISLNSAVHSEKAIRTQSNTTFTLMRATHRLEQVLNDLDSHRFPIFPVVHDKGSIRFSDGSFNPVHSTSATLRPNPLANAVTGMRLDLQAALQITSCARQGSEYHLQACQTFDAPADYREGFVALGVDGPFELQGSVAQLRSRCISGSLKATRSMTLAAMRDPIECGSLRQLVPIAAHYTIYLDQLGTLRLLSHRGSENVENQPIAKNISTLTLNAERPMNGALFRLNLELEAPSGQGYRASLINSLGREPIFNFIFNLPWTSAA